MLRQILLQLLLLLALAAIPAVISGFVHPKAPRWNEEALIEGEVRLETALKWGSQVLWVDARSQKDYDKEHIPGAVLLNEDDWNGLLGGLLDVWSPEKRIVIYCGGQACQPSQQVAKRLREEAGLSDVYVLKGGWEAWQK